MKTVFCTVGLVAFIGLARGVLAQPGDEVGKARKVFTPDITRAVLSGETPAPEGFDKMMAERIGEKRLKALRLGEQVEGRENDLAALALTELGVKRESLPIPERHGEPFRDQMKVTSTGARYKVAEGTRTGFFKTGQEADIVLSAIDFNNTGGPLLFNHPAGIASDGTRLLLSDRNNNRILIWNKLPTGNTPPDLVLGQPNFTSNNPGTGTHQLDWPSAVSIDQGRVVVADSYNSRILIWLTFPTTNGQPADLVFDMHQLARDLQSGHFEWPWGVWTQGGKLIVTSTQGTPAILIWTRFPTRTSDLPDIVMTHPAFGTPRYITSDGHRLIVWDHNAHVGNYSGTGTFFWKSFPTRSDQPYDFFIPHQAVGAFTSDHQLALLGLEIGLKIWNIFPADSTVSPDLVVKAVPGGPDDGHGIVSAGDKLYILRGNDDKIVGYLQRPTHADQKPDFVIGSPSLDIHPLAENFFITNPVPASNGKNLFVSSDFDRKLYVWKNLPDESGARPDLVYQLPFGPWQNALWKNTFVLAGQNTLYVWQKLPLEGEKPDLILSGQIGHVSLKDIRGVTLDDHYFYLADDRAGKVYVWLGIPSRDAQPLYTLDTGIATGRIYSNGEYLLVLNGMQGGHIKIYKISELGHSSPHIVKSGLRYRFNMPGSAIMVGERLLVADTGFGRVLGWDHLTDAVAGNKPKLILGATTLDDTTQEIGRDKLFWPAALSFDGSFLWVGEFKFSGRLLRFSVRR